MTTIPIVFPDSADPTSIPDGVYAHAMAYGDGDFKWPASQLARFQRHIVISVTRSSAAAAYAREKDVERGDATPADFWPFAFERFMRGHDDATCYLSLDNVPALIAAMPSHGFLSKPWRLHVAWWTGLAGPATVAEIVAELARLGVTMDPARIWAHQFASGKQLGRGYDLSGLLGADDFARTVPAGSDSDA